MPAANRAVPRLRGGTTGCRGSPGRSAPGAGDHPLPGGDVPDRADQFRGWVSLGKNPATCAARACQVPGLAQPVKISTLHSGTAVPPGGGQPVGARRSMSTTATSGRWATAAGTMPSPPVISATTSMPSSRRSSATSVLPQNPHVLSYQNAYHVPSSSPARAPLNFGGTAQLALWRVADSTRGRCPVAGWRVPAGLTLPVSASGGP